VIQFWWQSGSRFGSGSPKSEIRILRIGGGLWSLSISSLKWCTTCTLVPCAWTHTTHNRFTALLELVRDHPGEQVPEW